MKPVALAAALALAACRPPPRSIYPLAIAQAPTVPAPVAPARAAELVARARAHERATALYTASLRLVAHDLERNYRFNTHGAMAVRRPDALRMQAAGPGGVTVADLLALRGEYWLRLGSRAWDRGSIADAQAGALPAATLVRAFLGFDWDRAVIVADGRLAVARIGAPGAPASTLIAFDPDDGVVREVRWFAGGFERARVRLESFERVGAGVDAGAGADAGASSGGVRVPRMALFWQTRPDVTATITFDRHVMSPELPARTFQPPQ